MIDVEPLIISGLERLVPLPSGDSVDWQDVLRRAGIDRGQAAGRGLQMTRRRRAFALAVLAAALVVAVTTPVGAAIARGLGDFSSWLTGQPGKPASSAEQRAFQAVNERWPGFPTSTKLRELIRAEVAGKQYALMGFRSGSTACLRLAAPAFEQATEQRCLPASMLAHLQAPIVVVERGSIIPDTRNRPAAEVAFGFAATGVERVDVDAFDGSHQAFLGGNAYLFVEDRPNTGNQILRITAIGAHGQRSTIAMPNQIGPLGLGFNNRPAPRRAIGPTRIEGKIAQPRVGWSVHGGAAPHHIQLTAEQRRNLGVWATMGLETSLVKPDPLSDILVGYSGSCVVVSASPGEGFARACAGWKPSSVFSRGPLFFIGSDNAIAGVVADGVTRVMLFLANGERETVPLLDNLFAARYPPAQPPLKLVGYNNQGRVVAIQPLSIFFFARQPIPGAAKRLHPVKTLKGPGGAVAVLQVGPRVVNYRCWRIDFSTGQTRGTCEQQPASGPKIWVDFLQPAGRDLFVAGQVEAKITARVELHFENGDVTTTHAIAGHFLFAIPRTHLRAQQQFAYVLAIDHQGHHIQRQGIAFKANP